MNDEHLYEKATEELDGGARDAALWSKAMALAEGDEEKARYTYIRLRAEQLAGKDGLESSGRIVSSEKPNSFLVRFWRGEVGLRLSFLIALLGNLIYSAFFLNFQKTASIQAAITWEMVIMVVGLSWSIFIWVGLWRSALKSKAKVGPGFVQILVIIGVVVSAFHYWNWFSEKNRTAFSDSYLKKEALATSSMLPLKVDESGDTLLVGMKAGKRSLKYTYKVLSDEAEPIAKGSFAKMICDDKETRPMLDDGITLVYEFLNNQDKFQFVQSVKGSDCL